MNRATLLGERLRDLQARSEATDAAAAAAISELQQAGSQLADSMNALADAMDTH